ncbi:hypothetical protein TeGR_g13450 [Tetraparma gracilis]|jgi:hypothetical protein|uniref:Uncharacterized protein n=1 Tax=Tetraparma gracilis TaxID=2962635 RepID=A0ABQ6MND6_9STRA|nr:hypothetical protein TeGR_g13450 [Tetraparma gracilis]
MSSLEELQKTQGENLLSILQIEMSMEASRQERLAQVSDPDELEKMTALFDAQRQACQDRIEAMKAEHQLQLGDKAKKLVRYKKVAAKSPNRAAPKA